MSTENAFEIKRFDFNAQLFSEFQNIHYAKDLWPIVYILSDGSVKKAYVGETSDAYARMTNHLKDNVKSRLTTVHLIASEKFNKSATLDIESNLIKYISGDGEYDLYNLNIGLANHNYYQKKAVYWDIFLSIWDKLRSEGIAKKSIEHISNSDLFKYSPYKNLTEDQKQSLVTIVENLLSNNSKSVVVEGGAGTGKTILSTFLFKLLNSNLDDYNLIEFAEEDSNLVKLVKELKEKYPKPKMALVVPMASFRSTLKKVFRNVKDLNSNMVIGPSELIKDKFDIVVVDEAHRLRRRVNLGTYFGSFDTVCAKLGLEKNNCSELDWVLMQSEKTVLFYDQGQTIKPSDARKEDFDKLKVSQSTRIQQLKSQFRVKGGNDYVSYVDRLLGCVLREGDAVFNVKDYEFILFDSLSEMVDQIKRRNNETGLSRLVAGYSWEWISNKDATKKDIKINGVELKWNSVAVDWVNSENAIDEVGCIHTTQGYDLNYAGIILGNEIGYNKARNEIVIRKESYFDRNGKQSISNPLELKAFIVNIYKTLMLRGIRGTYLYVCDGDLREYFSTHVSPFRTQSRSAIKDKQHLIPFQNSVPLYSLKAAAGSFSEAQFVDENPDAVEWVELPLRYKPSRDLFACTVKGDSMNRVIPNGSICLFRRYTGGSRDGRIVLVQHTSIQDPDFGSGYTVKEYRSVKRTDGDEWFHESIILKPLSDNSEYKQLELVGDEVVDLKVVGFFEAVLQ